MQADIHCKHLSTTREGKTSDVETCTACGAQRDAYHPGEWWLPSLHDEAVTMLHLLGTAIGMASLNKPLEGQLLKNAESVFARVFEMLMGEKP